jgi:hypothetical protein
MQIDCNKNHLYFRQSNKSLQKKIMWIDQIKKWLRIYIFFYRLIYKKVTNYFNKNRNLLQKKVFVLMQINLQQK